MKPRAETVDFWALFKPTPRQVAFLQRSRTHRYLLYGGARGGGKSKLLRWGLLWQLIEWARDGHAKVRVGLFSEDYPTLKDRQITKIRAEFPHWLGELKSTQDEGHGFYLHESYGGGAILLRNLDDPSKYQSAEFAAIGVEELTKNDIHTFDVLRGSLRWPGIPRTQFWAATNPGGPGHLWVKQLWIDSDFSGEAAALAPRAHEFAFIKSLPSDNPHLTQEYWDELNSLTNEGLRKAWVEGNWDAFEGMAFDEWDRRVHVTTFEPEQGADRPNWRWAAGGDWGKTEQGVMYHVAFSDEHFVVRHEWLFKKTDPYTAGHTYGKLLMRFPRPEFISLDAPPMPDTSLSIIERFQAGINDAVKKNPPPVVQPPRSKGTRHTKKQLVHEALAFDRAAVSEVLARGEEVPPWLLPQMQVHEDCKYLIRTLPALPLDETDSEDVDSDAADHGYDALAGLLMARVPQAQRRSRERKDVDQHPGFAKRYELEPAEIGEGEVQWSRLPPGYEEDMGW